MGGGRRGHRTAPGMEFGMGSGMGSAGAPAGSHALRLDGTGREPLGGLGLAVVFPGSFRLFDSLRENLGKSQGWVSAAARAGNFVYELHGELKQRQEAKP